MRRRNIISLAVVPFLLASCAQLGSLGNILGALGGIGGGNQQQAQQLQAQVQQVDANRQVLYVRTQQGESGAVRFDSQTIVVYDRRQYPVTSLQPGDIVVLQLHQTSRNELYASRIDVTRPVQQRSFVR